VKEFWRSAKTRHIHRQTQSSVLYELARLAGLASE